MRHEYLVDLRVPFLTNLQNLLLALSISWDIIRYGRGLRFSSPGDHLGDFERLYLLAYLCAHFIGSVSRDDV